MQTYIKNIFFMYVCGKKKERVGQESSIDHKFQSHLRIVLRTDETLCRDIHHVDRKSTRLNSSH